jgi:hypothetical protein
MGTLKEDIKFQSDWITKAFAEDGFTLDYSIDSIIEVDRFFTKNMKNGQPKKKDDFMVKVLDQNYFL